MNEHNIHERAYYLWQKEGSPKGRDTEFWERASLMEQAAARPPVQTPLQMRTPAEAAIDTAMADTFPASDPPAFTAVNGLSNEPETPLTTKD